MASALVQNIILLGLGIFAIAFVIYRNLQIASIVRSLDKQADEQEEITEQLLEINISLKKMADIMERQIKKD